MLGIPIAAPNPDPIIQDIETRSIASQQPHIFRLLRLGVLAAERGQGLAFISEVSQLIWSGEVDWSEGGNLHQATARAGLNLEELEAQISKDAPRLDKVVEQNEADQNDAGHWGVPLMVFMGEPFFGQDRIDCLLWRMNQNGLSKRQ
jgi:2-hydroxychromene-2-carboxylate isomerase